MPRDQGLSHRREESLCPCPEIKACPITEMRACVHAQQLYLHTATRHFSVSVSLFQSSPCHLIMKIWWLLLVMGACAKSVYSQDTCRQGHSGIPGNPGHNGLPGRDGRDGSKGDKGDTGTECLQLLTASSPLPAGVLFHLPTEPSPTSVPILSFCH